MKLIDTNTLIYSGERANNQQVTDLWTARVASQTLTSGRWFWLLWEVGHLDLESAEHLKPEGLIKQGISFLLLNRRFYIFPSQ